MRQSYRNLWSSAAARMMAVAHTRAPMTRWLLLFGLLLVWAVAGFYGWLGGADIDEANGAQHRIGALEAAYRTVGALSMSDFYVPKNDGALNIARFAGLALPLIGLLFAFWGQLGRSLAQGLHQLSAHHIVIAGSGPAAIHLALDCRNKRSAGRDSVVLIASGLPDEMAWSLRRSGVYLIEAMGADRRTLLLARADRAAHVVAFEDDDTLNLQIEAAMRGLIGKAARNPPIAVHVGTRAPMLLREARAMRSTEQEQLDARNRARPPKQRESLAIDAKPFSLDEIAARRLIQAQAVDMLDNAAALKHERLHLVVFGFDLAAQALVSRAFMSLWSARFAPPRVTVLAPDPAEAEDDFRARHREAMAHPALWAADIAFEAFNLVRGHVDRRLLEGVQARRGPASAVIVSAGADPDNIRLSLALKRACNEGPFWPAPIYMKEASRSEFSAIYARGDETDERDAYLFAFGALQTTATRRDVIQGWLDQGAAIAHARYVLQQEKESAALDFKDLQAASRGWGDVIETYRTANRAVADAAMVKMWDAGFAPAPDKTRQASNGLLVMTDHLVEEMARREHDRWMAERLMNGWRPGDVRHNALLVHNKLVGWDALSEIDKENDRVQVRAALDIARMMSPNGLMKRG